MELNILTVLCAATFCKYAVEGAGPIMMTGFVINDTTIDAKIDSHTVTGIEENQIAGESVGFSVEAVVHEDYLTEPVTYTIDTQDPPNLLTIDQNSGLIRASATNEIDYEEHQNVELVIRATMLQTATATITVTIPIIGLNDNTPKFEEETYVENIRPGACPGTKVFKYMATDDDFAAPDNELVYTIASGNTDGMFTISATTGQVKVANKTEWREDHDRYDLVIKATDKGVKPDKLSSSITVALYVCGATSISLSLATLLVALLASLR